MWPFKDKKKDSPKIEAIKALTIIEINVVNYYHMVEGLLNTMKKGLRHDGHYQEGLIKISNAHKTNELILREIVEQIEALKGKR